jgi:Abortive infection alpha
MSEPPDETPEPERRGTMDDLPGLARLAASAWWHTTEWAVRSYAKAGIGLLRAVARPDTAPDFVDSVRDALREAAQEISGDGDEPHPTARGAGPDTAEWAQLRDHGAAILAKSRDVHYEETAHPAYERMLDELAPDEARILRLMMFDGPQPSIDVRTGGPLALLNSHLIAQGFTMIGARAGCRYPTRVPQYLNNLNRMGLIWFSRDTLHDPVQYQVLEAQPDVLEATKSVRMARVIRRSIHLTPFGEDFCRICLALDADELDELPEHGDPGEEPSIVPPAPPREGRDSSSGSTEGAQEH